MNICGRGRGEGCSNSKTDAACQTRPATLSQLSIVEKFLSLRPQRPGGNFLQPSRSSRRQFPDPMDSGGPVPEVPR